MNTIVGVDFGTKNIGLSIADTPLAEPLGTIVYKKTDEALEKLLYFLQKYQVKIAVFGISEGEMAIKTKQFAQRLRGQWLGKIFFQDETLTSQEATRKSVDGGKPKQKRKKQIHQTSACLVLQSFLDDHSNFLIQ